MNSYHLLTKFLNILRGRLTFKLVFLCLIGDKFVNSFYSLNTPFSALFFDLCWNYISTWLFLLYKKEKLNLGLRLPKCSSLIHQAGLEQMRLARDCSALQEDPSPYIFFCCCFEDLCCTTHPLSPVTHWPSSSHSKMTDDPSPTISSFINTMEQPSCLHKRAVSATNYRQMAEHLFWATKTETGCFQI